ncbi:MAG: restriction endonuclease subunit S [Longimicrobiales bacterium]
MPGEWKIEPLERLLVPGRGISYGIVQPGAPTADGIPIVRVADIRDGRIATEEPLRVSRNIEAAYSRTRLRGGELLLTLVGTVGEAAVVPDSLAGWNTARAVAVIPVRADIGSYWVKLALRSAQVRHIIDSRLNTTVQATLNLRDVAHLPIVMPPEQERHAIAHILGTLDDKIELNRRMSETLEAIARALFKSWFVDFDPVRAKAEGRDPRLPKPLADLFPDRLVDSELGEVPDGWETASVDDEFGLTMGQSPPGETYNEVGDGIPFYQGRADFGSRFPKRRVYCTAPTRLARKDDTLISVRAPVGDINMAAEACAIGRGVAAARHKTGSRSYTYQFMSSLEGTFARFEAEGTVFGSISKKDLHGIRCVAPSPAIVGAFDRLLSPLDSRIEALAQESHTLAAMRDALLPKLISGELRLNDAAAFWRP